MIIGVPKEIKSQENRIAITPAGVQALVSSGNRVLVQAGAGVGSGFSDNDFQAAGAGILSTPEEIFSEAELILKVKEPQPSEFSLFRSGQILFTYLHLAANEDLTAALQQSGCTAIAYETVQLDDGGLPLLIPMSQVAGRMSVQAGACALEGHHGSRGVLLSGIPGVRPGRVVILGGGTVGLNAAQMAVGLGADVVLLDINPHRLEELDLAFKGRLKTVVSNPFVIREEMISADLVIGAVLITGARAPRLAGRDILREMQTGAVIVDVAIDQGGCFETSRPTTHQAPTYIEEGVVHYCVNNMPGAVARTSTLGLANSTLPYLLHIAEGGLNAVAEDPALAKGVNIHQGKICHPAVAKAMGKNPEPFSP